MIPRERVLTAFEHKEPDCVPTWCGASPEFWKKAKNELGIDDEGLRLRVGDDFRRVFARYTGPEFTLSPRVTNRTPFGIERVGLGYGQPISHTLTNATLADIHNYPWPNPEWIDVSQVSNDARKYKGHYAILGGDWSPFWHDAIDLLGMENLYYKMYDSPVIVDAVMEHIVDYYVSVSQRIFDATDDAIDIFFIGNDFGSQTGPLIGEKLFRRFILPHLERLINLGHSYGKKVMLHCCGGFAPLISSMIEAGLDGLHAIQPDCHGMCLRKLKVDYGDKILFNGCIDSRNVLINGTPDSVIEKTCEVLDIMKNGGGFVAGASHDTILEETPLENVLVMFDTIREYGIYSN